MVAEARPTLYVQKEMDKLTKWMEFITKCSQFQFQPNQQQQQVRLSFVSNKHKGQDI
jgi:hypothetical protein